MAPSIETSGEKQTGFFGLPDQKRLLLIVVYTVVCTFFGVALSVLILDHNWESLFYAIICIAIFMLPMLAYVISESLSARKKKLELEHQYKKNELEAVIRKTEGNLKILLQNLKEKEGGDTVELIYREGTSKLAHVYAYAKEKLTYHQEKTKLIELMHSDMTASDIGIDAIEAVYSSLIVYSQLLKDLTDSLITIMPQSPEEVITMDDSDLYQSVIFEENSWLEHEALQMQEYLDLWVANHRKEVTEERSKLQELVTQQKNSLALLLEATNAMRDQSFSKIQVRL